VSKYILKIHDTGKNINIHNTTREKVGIYKRRYKPQAKLSMKNCNKIYFYKTKHFILKLT
jgi:hypothetical protein